MNLWTQQAAMRAIGPIAILASVNALARSNGSPYHLAVHRRKSRGPSDAERTPGGPDRTAGEYTGSAA